MVAAYMGYKGGKSDRVHVSGKGDYAAFKAAFMAAGGASA